jgi:hypothetical protein
MDRKTDGDDPGNATPEEPLFPPPVNPAVKKTQVTSQSANIGAAQEEPPVEFKREFHIFEIVSLGVNVVLLLVGIAAVCVYRGQLAVMSNTLEEMKRSGQGAAEQTNQLIGNANWLARTMQGALEASERQNRDALNASIATSRTDQRAWLGIKDITLVNTLKPGEHVIVGVNTLNSGKTPAIEASLIEASAGTDEKKFTMELIRPEQGASKVAVAPTATTMFYMSFDGSDATTKALIDGVLRVYVRGRIGYRDIFGREHKTLFCAYYPTPVKTTNFSNCANGNSMD